MGIKLVFMGSATFAVPSLNQLFESGCEIVAVITQPDKPSGRGQLLQSPPVKKRAFELNIPIFQPKSLKTEEARDLMSVLQPIIIVVVAYGKLLPAWLLQLPVHGCVNLHGSILPKYRGAAPVHWAIANGEDKTGVCTMLLDEGLDTGPVYCCKETAIAPEETAPQLYDRLAEIGAPLLLETVNGIVNGEIKPRRQDDSQSTLAPLLNKEDGFIDWTMPAAAIHNRVRAFNPWPGTMTQFRGSMCKVLQTRRDPVEANSSQSSGPSEPGTLVAGKRSLAVVCGDGMLLQILSIQAENRKPVSGTDFANGARILRDEKFRPVMDN